MTPTDDWKEAVIDCCVVSCIGWDESDPRGSLHSLIAWENQIALDPAVSSEAQALIDRGRREAWIDSSVRMPEAGQLIVKRWTRKGSHWAGVYSGSPKDSSFDHWMPLSPIE